MVQKFKSNVEMNSYIYGEHAFHYIIDESTGLWFVCMADRAMGKRIPIAFLGATQEQFKSQYTVDDVQAARAYGMTRQFASVIQGLMEKFNSPEADRVTHLTEIVNKIKDDAME